MKKLLEKINKNKLELMARILEIFGAMCIAVSIVWLIILDIKFNLAAQYLFEVFIMTFIPGLLLIFTSFIMVNKKNVLGICLISGSEVLLIVNVILNYVFKANDPTFNKGITNAKGNIGLYHMNNALSIIIMVFGLFVLAAFVCYYIFDKKEDKEIEAKENK